MFSRPQKLSHLDTIQYEIYMLNYCYGKLLEEKWENTPDNYISLECFLLHYRNLIEFFGDSEDLKVSEWKDWALLENYPLKCWPPSGTRSLSIIIEGKSLNTFSTALRAEQKTAVGMPRECMKNHGRYWRISGVYFPSALSPDKQPVFLRMIIPAFLRQQ